MATPPITRAAGSLPFPNLPAGTPNQDMPFDHVVVVMMENHSFDNLLGDLGRTRTDVEALTFESGSATNSNPGTGPDPVRAYPLGDTAQAKGISQSWKATHEQIDGGAMDGFVSSEGGGTEAMGYYTPEVLPFAYSLAETFTLANRWFSSVPGPTYPNRRFLLAGTAFGGTATNADEIINTLESPPPNGTIFDRLSDRHISWCNYFTDIPMTAVILSTIIEHLGNHRPRSKFFEDCAAGTLPSVSFVDPGMGPLSSVADSIKALPELVKTLLKRLDPGETQETPDDMYYGEKWAYEVVKAVTESPAWDRTLLIYTYDEHGGYYDHLQPPAAPIPDTIAPRLGAGDPPGDYGSYGPRVPAVVVSPYSRPGGVTNVVHDHTSILATIEHKWNLPALTNRDANAATVMDFLDLGQSPLLDPPPLAEPSEVGPSGPVTARAPGGAARPAPSQPNAEPDPPQKGIANMLDRLKKIADDPVDRYAKLVALNAPPVAALSSDTLEGVISSSGDEVAALSRHVAEHSNLSLAQATPVVKAAIDKSTQEGKTEPKAKAEAVSKATAGLTGATANVELSDPVMLDPIYRVVFAGFMSLLFALCVVFVAVVGKESSSQESALIGLSVLGVLALIAVLVLVMGYKNVKITGAGPSAGGGGS